MHTFLKTFCFFGLLASYYFSCVHQSREELSNLNGNEKHETGRKVIGARFYVPISIFTATKRALWEYMNIHGYTILNNLALLDVYSLHKCFPRLGWVIPPALRNAAKVFDLLILCGHILQLLSLPPWLVIMKSWWIFLNVDRTPLTPCFSVFAHRCPDSCWFVRAGALMCW